MSEPGQWGRYYWCIKVPEAVSLTSEIYVMADRLEVLEDGSLVCWGHYPDDAERPLSVLGLAPTQWTAFYAASALDGSAVAVDHWVGELARTASDAKLEKELRAKKGKK